ncbi:hypothetical protein GGD83_002472 [Rhodoblastus sphagnicola]|nr:hypothetical protein [Rhodoblastus sphagnicola]
MAAALPGARFASGFLPSSYTTHGDTILVEDLRVCLTEQRAKLSAKTDLAKDIYYRLSRRVAFTRFLDDGRVCLTNDAAERPLRGIAVGRRDWTFAGSDAGAIGPQRSSRRSRAASSTTPTRRHGLHGNASVL